MNLFKSTENQNEITPFSVDPYIQAESEFLIIDKQYDRIEKIINNLNKSNSKLETTKTEIKAKVDDLCATYKEINAKVKKNNKTIEILEEILRKEITQ